MAIKFFKDNKIKDLSGVGYLALATILDKTYPVGTYYETSDVNFNPNEEFIGEWIEDTKGLVLVGAYSEGTYRPGNDRTYIIAGETLGETNHTLTVAEMPTHYHPFKSVLDNVTDSGSSLPKGSSSSGNNRGWSENTPGDGSVNCPVGSSGGNQTHNNVQPSIGVYRWHRIS